MPPTPDPRPQYRSAVRVLAWLSLPALIAAFVLLHHWSLSDLPVAAQPKCTLYVLTGLHCPGCGTGRALRLLARGDVLGALRHNLFLFVALPILIYAYAGWFLRLAVGLDLPWRGWPLRLCWGLAAFVIVFWVARNLPWWPCTLLAPPPHSWERDRPGDASAGDSPGPATADPDGGHGGRGDPGPLGERVPGHP